MVNISEYQISHDSHLPLCVQLSNQITHLTKSGELHLGSLCHLSERFTVTLASVVRLNS